MKCLVISIFLCSIVYCEHRKEFMCPNEENTDEFRAYFCEEDAISKDCISLFWLPNNLDVDNVKQLKLYDCELNYTDKFVKKFEQLQTLDISKNNYSSLNFFKLNIKYLVKFNASHNKFNEIPMNYFDGTPEISVIDFSFNKLKRIDANTFDNAIKLTTINLSHNNIEKINSNAFSKLIDLDYVDLKDNSLKEINGLFDNNKKLNILHIEHNNFDAVQEVKANSVYVSWRDYEIFHTHRLNSKQIHVKLNDEYEGFFRTLNGTIELYCNTGSFEILHFFEDYFHVVNNINNLLKCFSSSIKYLEIDTHEIMNYTVLKPFVKLENLLLFHQQINIKELMHNLNEKITRLYLYNCLIGEVDVNIFENHTELKRLSLIRTKITFTNFYLANKKNFDFSAIKNLLNLEFLDISSNDLEYSINSHFLTNLTKLKNICISHNQFKDVQTIIQHLSPEIETLELSYNHVGELNATTFENKKNLKELDIDFTDLTFSDFNPFEGLQNLKKLDISGNNLREANLTLLSSTFHKLKSFRAKSCQIGFKLQEISKHFGSSLCVLILNGNFIEKTNSSEINTLDLSNLPIADSDYYSLLDISNNKLSKVILPSSSRFLQEIDLSENELTRIDGLTRKNFPMLSNLQIEENRFSCDYLNELLKGIRSEWPYLNIFRPEKQQHGTCNISFIEEEEVKIEQIEEQTTISTLATLDYDEPTEHEYNYPIIQERTETNLIETEITTKSDVDNCKKSSTNENVNFNHINEMNFHFAIFGRRNNLCVNYCCYYLHKRVLYSP